MPTYRNDGDVTYRINDTDDLVQNVHPGESIETYDPNPPSDFTETVETPTLEKTISGENVWTDGIKPKGGLNYSISGEFVGTATIQRCWDDFASPKLYLSYAGSGEGRITDDADPHVKYRIGVDKGGYSSGTLTVKLSRTS